MQHFLFINYWLTFVDLSPSSSKNVRAASVGAPIRISKTTQQESQTSQPTEAAQHQSLDNQLRALDQFYQNKVLDSLLYI